MKKKYFTLLPMIVIFTIYCDAIPATVVNNKAETDKAQRTPYSPFDIQKNTVSNIELYNTNIGILGHKYNSTSGGGFWPRGSGNQYIFASGIWFGAMKLKNDSLVKYTSITYSPDNGKSCYVPGRIEDGNKMDTNKARDYRVYFSTDFNKSDGVPYDHSDGPNWPIWDSNPTESLNTDSYYGSYIIDPANRNKAVFPKGPAFISDEDIFTTFKDTDLDYYLGDYSLIDNAGYPLNLQYEQTIYSWGSEEYKDIIFIRYEIKNMSKDTLYNCWFSPVFDTDIGLFKNSKVEATNDRCSYFFNIDSLNLAVNWSNNDCGEEGKGFGYVGYEFLGSPSVKRCEKLIDTTVNGVPGEYCSQCTGWEVKDGVETCTNSIIFDPAEENFIRNDKKAYLNREQLGMCTFRNWTINSKPMADDERYNFISTVMKDGDNGPGDKRQSLSTGPFNMLPGDIASVWVGVAFAIPVVNQEPDGTVKDIGLSPGGAIYKNSLLDKIYRSRKLFENKLLLGVGVDDQPKVDNHPACSVYPNPATDYAIIELNNGDTDITKFELFNLRGEIIEGKELSATGRYTLSLTGIPTGCYILKVYGGNECMVEKFSVVK